MRKSKFIYEHEKEKENKDNLVTKHTPLLEKIAVNHI
jgi:hypothetical protein